MSIKREISSHSWDEMYAIAEKYYKKNGNLSVDGDFLTSDGINYDSNGVCLRNWILSQRKRIIFLLTLPRVIKLKKEIFKRDLEELKKVCDTLENSDNELSSEELLMLKKGKKVYSNSVSSIQNKFDKPFPEAVSSDELYKLLSIGILKSYRPQNNRLMIGNFLFKNGIGIVRNRRCPAEYADVNKYPELLKKNYIEVLALEDYLIKCGLDISVNGELNPIFLMSDENIEKAIGKSMVDIVFDYFPKKEELVKGALSK